jgi:hypothetical protein
MSLTAKERSHSRKRGSEAKQVREMRPRKSLKHRLILPVEPGKKGRLINNACVVSSRRDSYV